MKKYVIPLLLFSTLVFFMTPSLFAFDSNAKGYVEGGMEVNVGRSFLTVLPDEPTTQAEDPEVNYQLNHNWDGFSLASGYYLNNYLSLGISFNFSSIFLQKIESNEERSTDQKQADLPPSGDYMLNINKVRTLINIAYHYNIMDNLNLFVTPAIGFDSNFIDYGSRHTADAFTGVSKLFNIALKLSAGGIYYLSDTVYTKGTISYNYAGPMFNGKSLDYIYRGKAHTPWIQFGMGIGTRFK